MYYVYILRSGKDGSYYIGQTNEIENRLRKHNAGHSNFTKSRRPYRLIYTEEYPTRGDAMRREREIKLYKGDRRFKKLIGID